MELVDKEETINLRKKHIGDACQLFYRSNPLKIVRAEKQYMYDEQGQQYLDCINNVAHVGHCHPHVVEAAVEQMKVQSTNNRFLHDNIVLYAKRLTRLLPSKLSVCFFCNSGSEANDLALRLARAHTAQYDVVTVDHAYHGHLTNLIDISPYKFNGPGGSGKQPWVHVAPCPDSFRGKYRDTEYSGNEICEKYVQDVRDLISEAHKNGRNIAAFIAESMQSCGGQVIFPQGYLRQVYKLIREAGGVCIADEVQVGFGRVGDHWWAFQHQGNDIVPDIVTIGKPIGNGHPVSVVVTTPEIAASMADTGMAYFSTFGGNAVSCAIANAVLDVIENEKLIENAKEVGSYLLKKATELMSKHKIVGDVRGIGLFLGIDLVKNRISREPASEEAKYAVERAKELGVIISRDGPYENVLKMKPPMVFNKQNVDTVMSVLEKIMQEVESGLHSSPKLTTVYLKPTVDTNSSSSSDISSD